MAEGHPGGLREEAYALSIWYVKHGQHVIVGAIGHGVSPAMPVMPVLRVYRACASPSIVLKPRSTKTRAHELIPGALTVKTASFDDCRPANPRGSCDVPPALENTQTTAKFLRILPHRTALHATS